MKWILDGEFHGLRSYHDATDQWSVEVDCWGEVKRVFKFAGIDSNGNAEYHETQNALIKSIRFDQIF